MQPLVISSVTAVNWVHVSHTGREPEQGINASLVAVTVNVAVKLYCFWDFSQLIHFQVVLLLQSSKTDPFSDTYPGASD